MTNWKQIPPCVVFLFYRNPLTYTDQYNTTPANAVATRVVFLYPYNAVLFSNINHTNFPSVKSDIKKKQLPMGYRFFALSLNFVSNLTYFSDILIEHFISNTWHFDSKHDFISLTPLRIKHSSFVWSLLV